MNLEITELDPADLAAMTAWHATYHAADVDGRAYSTPWMFEEMRADLLAERSSELVLAFSGVHGDDVVTTGQLRLPLLDNLRTAFLDLHTHPDHRNRGYATAMLEHLAGVARRHDRQVLLTETSFPYEGPADGFGHPYVEFLKRRGFSLGIADVMRVLDLPADTDLLRRLAAEAAPFHRSYRIRQFAGPVPEDLVDSFAELVGTLMTEAPTGELELEPEVYDADRIRADEKVFEASGRTKYVTVALTQDGTVAAYSELIVPAHDPGRVYQWGTLAHPEHRGHRLGLATKARNLLYLQAEAPERTLLVTYNADVNSHMIAVNEQMGFRPVERLGEFQKRLS